MLDGKKKKGGGEGGRAVHVCVEGHPPRGETPNAGPNKSARARAPAIMRTERPPRRHKTQR